jgi:hypothetical protein
MRRKVPAYKKTKRLTAFEENYSKKKVPQRLYYGRTENLDVRS